MVKIRTFSQDQLLHAGDEVRDGPREVSVAEHDWEPNPSFGFAETHGYVKTMRLDLEAFWPLGTQRGVCGSVQLTNPPATRMELRIYYGDQPDTDCWGEPPHFFSSKTGITTKDIQSTLDKFRDFEDARVQLIPSWLLVDTSQV